MVLLLSLLVACARHVEWQVQPVPSYALPSLDITVVAGDRECKRVADALAYALGSRPGVLVRPDAPQRLEVRDCDERLHTTVEIDGVYPGLGYGNETYREQRRFTVRGLARAELKIGRDVTLLGSADRRMRGPWITDGDLDIPATLTFREDLRRDVALDLADQLAPLPSTIRRTLYVDPEPGTARELHNAAVDAEREGQLDRALELARQAYAADPSPSAMRYIEALQSHAASVGYALREGSAPR
jgi:hypothetical protein